MRVRIPSPARIRIPPSCILVRSPIVYKLTGYRGSLRHLKSSRESGSFFCFDTLPELVYHQSRRDVVLAHLDSAPIPAKLPLALTNSEC